MESDSRRRSRERLSSWSLVQGRYLCDDGVHPGNEWLQIVSLVRVVVGVLLTAWGAFLTVVIGPGSVSQGNGSAVALGFGFLAAGLFTAVPRSHRVRGVAALASLVVGVLLIVAGYKVSLEHDWSGIPRDWTWWLHRLGGATLIALGGLAIGRLPSRPTDREVHARAA